MKAIKSLSVVCFLFIFIFSFSTRISAQEIIKKQETTNEQPKPDKLPAETLNSNVISKSGEERYRIGLQDILEVSVYRHPELSQPNIRMDETGRINLPRIDTSILAVCKTENELQTEIANLYRQSYLREPYVRVFVKEQNSRPLSVIGAVLKPGQFFTNRRLTLIELLTFAGGQDVARAGTKIQIVSAGGISGCSADSNTENPETKESEIMAFTSYKLDDVLRGKVNPVMKPGDIVIIAEVEQAYVTGNVVRPTAINLKQTLTLTQAIAAAGGTLPSTKKSVVRIVRQGGENAAKQELIFNLNDIKDRKIPDPQLLANDIVEVPTDKLKSFTESLIRAATGSVGTLFYRIP
jgi:polysaccharide export outer membrane protein